MTTSGPAQAKVRLSHRRIRWPVLRRRWSVAAKFYLVLGVLAAAMVHIAVVGLVGFARIDARTTALDAQDERRADVVDLLAALSVTERAAFRLAATQDPITRAELHVRLGEVLVPAVARASRAVRTTATGASEDKSVVAHLVMVDSDLAAFDDLRRRDSASMTAVARLFGAMNANVGALLSDDEAAVAELRASSDRDIRNTRGLLYGSIVACLAIGLIVIRRLIKDLVPRIVEYSHFATDVASGQGTTSLRPRGRDEVADLGRALNDLVATNERRSANEATQAAFVATLQLTASEDEAHDLVQRHIETSVDGTAAVVLACNNSANRIEAVTALGQGSHLAGRLVGAEPRACLAVRLGRTHHEAGGTTRLLPCGVCADPPRTSVCEPLVVGGEVIGSVLVSHSGPIDPEGRARVRAAVIAAAPVLANLRNLSLAQFRANNDALTGLANKRASSDALKRMVAQANRSVTSLVAIMLDLDHFKQINDQFGHGKGDEVLAAVGVALSSSLRASDFAGRFGGEEFLVLLPETTLDGAVVIAEKIRLAIAALAVPDIHAVTASLGIADLLQHAGSSERLLREADRALYSAKAAGRNRTVVATTEPVARSTTSTVRLPDDVPDVRHPPLGSP